MKKLLELTEPQFNSLKETGLLWEFYPDAPEFYKDIGWECRVIREQNYTWPKMHNLKIGDSIKYQLPLFDPQDGKITKKFTDSVVVNDNIHVSEKYIIKKMENKINIKDLKVGDRIKFYTYGLGYKFEYESIITEIRGLDKIIITSGIHVDKKDIISKLEPLPPQYKEIPIEKEISCKICNNYTNSDTKVTDYICPLCQIKENSAPKNFKFSFWPIKVNEFWKNGKLIRTMDGYDSNRTDFENVPCPDWITFGKSYTIEIKEKE